MALITLPDTSYASGTFQLLRDDTAIQLAGGQSVIMTGRTRLWGFQLSLPVKSNGEERAWLAAMAQMADIANTFQITPPGYDGPGNGYSGTNPVISGANQLGKSVVVAGPVNTTLALVGDYMQLGSELKIMTSNMTTDATGKATVTFEPAIRTAPTDASAVDIQTPKATFRSAAPRMSYNVEPPFIFTLSISAVEHVSV